MNPQQRSRRIERTLETFRLYLLGVDGSAEFKALAARLRQHADETRPLGVRGADHARLYDLVAEIIEVS